MRSTKKSKPYQGWAFAAIDYAHYRVVEWYAATCYIVLDAACSTIAQENARKRIGRITKKHVVASNRKY
jgi:hypothetical protein